MSMVRLEKSMTNYRPGPGPTRTGREWHPDLAAIVARRVPAAEELTRVDAGVQAVLSGEKVTPTHRVWYHAYARQVFAGGWSFGEDVRPEDVLIDTWCRRGLSRPVLEMIRNEVFAIMMLDPG